MKVNGVVKLRTSKQAGKKPEFREETKERTARYGDRNLNCYYVQVKNSKILEKKKGLKLKIKKRGGATRSSNLSLSHLSPNLITQFHF